MVFISTLPHSLSVFSILSGVISAKTFVFNFLNFPYLRKLSILFYTRNRDVIEFVEIFYQLLVAIVTLNLHREVGLEDYSLTRLALLEFVGDDIQAVATNLPHRFLNALL